MRTNTFIFCILIAVVLLLPSGCYTVFQHSILDDKPAVADSSQSEDNYSGDYVYRTLRNDRWNYYLTYPWWHGSIWHGHYAAPEYEHGSHDDGQTDTSPAPMTPPPSMPGGAAISPSYETPHEAPAQVDEVRTKGESASQQDTTKSESTEPPKKPGRRGGEGEPK